MWSVYGWDGMFWVFLATFDYRSEAEEFKRAQHDRRCKILFEQEENE